MADLERTDKSHFIYRSIVYKIVWKECLFVPPLALFTDIFLLGWTIKIKRWKKTENLHVSNNFTFGERERGFWICYMYFVILSRQVCRNCFWELHFDTFLSLNHYFESGDLITETCRPATLFLIWSLSVLTTIWFFHSF